MPLRAQGDGFADVCRQTVTELRKGLKLAIEARDALAVELDLVCKEKEELEKLTASYLLDKEILLNVTKNLEDELLQEKKKNRRGKVKAGAVGGASGFSAGFITGTLIPFFIR